MPEDNSNPYRVVTRDQQHVVVDPSDREIVVCRDAANAAHYAALLNQAYHQGHRDGFRAARVS